MDRLEPVSADFEPTRLALHKIAEEIVAPARKPHNEIALRHTPGGFGTPRFEFEGAECQVRVEGYELVVERGTEKKRAPLTTPAAAAELVGADLLPDVPPTDTEPLGIDPAAAGQLAAFYAF